MSNILTSQFVNTYKTIDELKQALSRYDNEALLDALVYVIYEYIINSETDAGAVGATRMSPAIDPIDSNINDTKNSSEGMTFNKHNEIKSDHKADEPETAETPETPGETYKRFSNLEIE